MAKLAQIGDAAPCRGHTEWSTNLLELVLDPKRWHRRPLSNASKNAPFWCRMRELWPKQWRRVCWIRGWRGSWVGDELQLGEDHNVSVSSVAMSSSSSPSWIGFVLDSILAMSSSVLLVVNVVGEWRTGRGGAVHGAAADLVRAPGPAPSGSSLSSSSSLGTIAMWSGGLGLVWLWGGLLLFSPQCAFQKAHFSPLLCLFPSLFLHSW
jgi:hypothetical protein